jgi:iron-sulfur cluster assembly accessory protein
MITLTDAATTKVSELIQDEATEDVLALRVAVRPGGCSGFSYEMFFDSDFAEDDSTLAFGEVKVVVDASSAMLLEGATLDFNDGL